MAQQIAGKACTVIYSRVSSKEQEKEGYSIPAQEKLLRAYAESQELTIAREFTDIETAKKSGQRHSTKWCGT